jgi:hypothetical protein
MRGTSRRRSYRGTGTPRRAIAGRWSRASVMGVDRSINLI